MYVLEAALIANLRHRPQRPNPIPLACASQGVSPLLRLATALAAVGLFAAAMNAPSTTAGTLTATCDTKPDRC